jgi:hypothetical protein
MRLFAASLVLGLLFAASGAQAGVFGNGDKLPTPVDYPTVRPKVKETHKIPHMFHPAKYEKAGWGAPKYFTPVRPLAHYMTQ